MIFTYHPDGAAEPRSWTFKPTRLLSVEAEAIERVTGWDYGQQFASKLMGGNMLARRALLWVLLRRDTPGLAFDSVSLCMDDVGLRSDDDELRRLARARPDLGPEEAEAATTLLAAHGWDQARIDAELDPTQAAPAAT